jgi:pimeloyl-ACP methyl ester carboxylesterase
MHIQANGIGIEIDVQGRPDGEPLLLVMGLGMQLVAWHEELVQLLVARGFRVIRFDNRDVGLSQTFDHLGVPNVWTAALRHGFALPIKAPYTLDDMARDAVGVLDALHIPQAHVCGASMGGMIAQVLAARHAPRVKSLTLMMTTSGARHLPAPSLKVRAALISRPRSHAEEALVDHLFAFFQLIGSPAYRGDPQWLRQRLQAGVRRAYHPAGTARQLVAVAAHGDRTPMLPEIGAPTHVIHGMADPLIPVAAGHDLQSKIHGATADFIDGMGHDLPLALLPRFADGLAATAARVPRPAAQASNNPSYAAGAEQGGA